MPLSQFQGSHYFSHPLVFAYSLISEQISALEEIFLCSLIYMSLQTQKEKREENIWIAKNFPNLMETRNPEQLSEL